MIAIDRRLLLTGGLAATAVRPAIPPAAAIPLWPGRPAGGDRVTVRQVEAARPPGHQPESSSVEGVTTPSLTAFLPERPNGASLLIIPGGGYVRIAVGHEGNVPARWYAERGYTAYVLRYRLPGDGWNPREEVSLADAQRAMRLIRARAAASGLDPARTAVIGFSAGGHLAARLTTQSDRATYTPVDATDRLSARPLASALLYPVITMGPGTHGGSRDTLLGADQSPARLAAFSAERLVTPRTPPTFLATAGDDATVPIANSLAMHAALVAATIPAELHIFDRGGHGFGLYPAAATLSPWPDLFAAFARRHGLTA